MDRVVAVLGRLKEAGNSLVVVEHDPQVMRAADLIGAAAAHPVRRQGERLKLARTQAGEAGRTLYLFDEPTTGLHFEDIAKLLKAFRRLIAAGHSLIVIEHKLDVIAAADWIIDLGPEGGGCGGRLLAAETPEEALAACADSHTGQALAPFLASRRPPE